MIFFSSNAENRVIIHERITICHDNDGTLTEVIINGKTFYGEYYGLSEDLASAIDIILADEKSYAYSKCIGRNEKGKKIYKYGIYKASCNIQTDPDRRLDIETKSTPQ